MKGLATAILALLAAAPIVHGFGGINTWSRIKSVSSLQMGSSDEAYDKQMKVYYDNIDTPSSATAATLEKPSPAGGASKASYTITEQAIIEAAAEKLAAEMLDSSRAAASIASAQAAAVVTQSEEPKEMNGLQKAVYLGIGFVGLPLWFLLSSIVFFPQQQSVMSPPTTQSAARSIQLPPTPTPSASAISAPKPAGVVVLSQPITKAEVRGLFGLWNDALHTLDPATVAKRYAKEGVLLPTLSDVPRNDVEGIKDYFVHFLEKKPDGKILEGEIFIGNNWAQDAGIYEFTFEDGSKVKARYSFVYVYEDGQWMISHHHSSLMPEEVVRPKAITQQEVRGLFNLWNDALHTGDPQQVAARYTKDAVLLPTLSDTARYTTDGIADYFVHFLEKKPDGKILEGNVKIGPNWAQDAGIYEFTFADGSSVQGRYSFVYAFENGEWKISNHHSSIMPEKAVAAMKKVAAL